VAALSCPFCRRRPAPNSVATYGLNLLGDLRMAVEEGGSWIYAWCADCGFARRFVERVCAAGAPPEVTRWQCDACGEADGLNRLRVKHCPGCKTATQKTGGCDHIECPTPECGVHWCFNCGEEIAREDIYNHMSVAHGGWYDGLEEEPGSEDDDVMDD